MQQARIIWQDNTIGQVHRQRQAQLMLDPVLFSVASKLATETQLPHEAQLMDQPHWYHSPLCCIIGIGWLLEIGRHKAKQPFPARVFEFSEAFQRKLILRM
eukprot:scaffold105829_cov25-Tisochrysis_lutea.AAC.1